MLIGTLPNLGLKHLASQSELVYGCTSCGWNGFFTAWPRGWFARVEFVKEEIRISSLTMRTARVDVHPVVSGGKRVEVGQLWPCRE